MRALLAAVAALLVTAPAAQGAELFYGVTESNRLVTFASDSPGAVRSSVPISGTLESEHILALAVRPSGGGLYGLGSANLLYRIDAATGHATALGPEFEVPIRGASYGMDFDPVTGLPRLVSDLELNMRADPDTGATFDSDDTTGDIEPDSELHYADGDVSAGTGSENVGAIAYTPVSPTTLFGIDTTFDTLVRIDPQNQGLLNTVGGLGMDADDEANGFDIAADGTAYAVLRRQSAAGQELFTVDLATGALRRAARLSAVGTYVRARRDPLVALVAAGSVANDRTRPGVVFTPVRTPSLRGLLRRRPLVLQVSCSEACRIRAVLRSGRRGVASQVRYVRESAGVVKMRLRLTRRGRRVVRRNPGRRLRLDVSARDAAGNVTSSARARRRSSR